MGKFTIPQTPILLLLLVSLITFFSIGSSITDSNSVVPSIEFRPVEPTQHRVMVNSTGDRGSNDRRRLAPFQLCILCKCCATTDPTNCATMPCCFGIDCHLPDKPFGTCAFVPNSCNCTSCAM